MTKRASVATLNETLRSHREDLKKVETAAIAASAAYRHLEPARLKPEALLEERKAIAEKFNESTAATVQTMRERLALAKAAKEEWTPAALRLRASLADPATSSAIAARLQSVPTRQLLAWAQEAAAEGNWVLADGVARVVSGRENDPDVDAVTALLDGMGGEEVKAAQLAIGGIQEMVAQVNILSAAGNGRPIRSSAMISMGIEFPDLKAPALV